MSAEDDAIMTSSEGVTIITNNANTIDTNPESITVLVNKEYSLPSDYVPKDLVVPNVLFNFNYVDDKRKLRKVAAHALEDLFSAAQDKGLILYGISGYRSYTRQNEIYTKNIQTMGVEHTNLYSAKPGFSEHQTGLAIDVSTISVNNRLDEGFAATPESKWLESNSYKFGFIIRYPKDKCDITGYSYEPWHIRYVGKPLAEYLYNNNLTLEEYYNYTPSAVIVEEDSYGTVIDVDSADYEESKDNTEPSKRPISTPSAIPTTETDKNGTKPAKPVKTKVPDPTATPTQVTPTPEPTSTPVTTPEPEPEVSPTPLPSDTPDITAQPEHTQN